MSRGGWVELRGSGMSNAQLQTRNCSNVFCTFHAVSRAREGLVVVGCWLCLENHAGMVLSSMLKLGLPWLRLPHSRMSCSWSLSKPRAFGRAR